MKLIKISDQQYIKRLLSIDSLYKNILDTEFLNSFNLNNTFWFSIFHNEEIIGIIGLNSLSNNCASFHGGLYKKYRHINSPELLKIALTLLHEIYPDVVFITTVPSNNLNCIKLLNKTGLIHKTTIKNGYKNNDMLIYSEEL